MTSYFICILSTHRITTMILIRSVDITDDVMTMCIQFINLLSCCNYWWCKCISQSSCWLVLFLTVWVFHFSIPRQLRDGCVSWRSTLIKWVCTWGGLTRVVAKIRMCFDSNLLFLQIEDLQDEYSKKIKLRDGVCLCVYLFVCVLAVCYCTCKLNYYLVCII